MEQKESQDQNKKEIDSVLSLFSSDIIPIIPQRRINSDPLPTVSLSVTYKKDNKEQNIINEESPELKAIPYTPEIKQDEKGNILLNSNSYGFKGRSPYASTASSENNTQSATNNNNVTSFDINNDNDNSTMNSNQKIINGFIFTELKDKVFEYRCSVCNFIAHSNSELHKHLAITNHFILPKKAKKNNKTKNFHKQENRLNQTFIFSINKPKKFYDKKLICKHCSKRFESIYALNSHLNAHKYKCDICYKLFNNKEDLLEHKHSLEERNDMNSPVKKKGNKFQKELYKEEKNKIEIDDWEEIPSNKKEKKKNNKKKELGESYAFIEDNDENIDFNRMVRITDEI